MVTRATFSFDEMRLAPTQWNAVPNLPCRSAAEVLGRPLDRPYARAGAIRLRNGRHAGAGGPGRSKVGRVDAAPAGSTRLPLAFPPPQPMACRRRSGRSPGARSRWSAWSTWGWPAARSSSPPPSPRRLPRFAVARPRVPRPATANRGAGEAGARAGRVGHGHHGDGRRPAPGVRGAARAALRAVVRGLQQLRRPVLGLLRGGAGGRPAASRSTCTSRGARPRPQALLDGLALLRDRLAAEGARDG